MWVCVCACGLTLLVTLEFGQGGVPVEDGPVEAQLVVQGLLGILEKYKNKERQRLTADQPRPTGRHVGAPKHR